MAEEDIFNEETREDNEILKSIEYAEKQLHAKMGVPQLVKGKPYEPVHYDVEDENYGPTQYHI